MNQRTIMVVEDDPDHLKLMELLLKQFSYKIITADSGENILNNIRNDKPDLILLDVMMPGKSGYDVCLEIRKTEDVKNIPIFMVSAKATADDIKRGINVGANKYIIKPFDPYELAEKINRFFN